MQEILFKIRLKEGYQKALKKLTLFFLLNQVSFNWQNYQKQKGYETSNQSLFRLRNKFRNIPLFVIYYLTKFDEVMLGSFWVIPKITAWKEDSFSQKNHRVFYVLSFQSVCQCLRLQILACSYYNLNFLLFWRLEWNCQISVGLGKYLQRTRS